MATADPIDIALFCFGVAALLAVVMLIIRLLELWCAPVQLPPEQPRYTLVTETTTLRYIDAKGRKIGGQSPAEVHL